MVTRGGGRRSMNDLSFRDDFSDLSDEDLTCDDRGLLDLRPGIRSDGGRKKDGVDLFARCVGAECAGDGGSYRSEGARCAEERAMTSPVSDAVPRGSM